MANLEQELIALKGRVERLEATVGRLAGTEQPTPSIQPGESPDPDRLKAWLKAQGLVSDVPPLAHAYAARWRRLPEEEKQAIQGGTSSSLISLADARQWWALSPPGDFRVVSRQDRCWRVLSPIEPGAELALACYTMSMDVGVYGENDYRQNQQA